MYAADRRVAEEVASCRPQVVAGARANRAFLARAVGYLAGQRGIRQFLDIGPGLPAPGNTHEVAQAIAPESRVVYADNDPLVLSHARALLTSSREGACEYFIDADLRDPETILKDAARTLDFTQPAAVMLVAILHFLAFTDRQSPDLASDLGFRVAYMFVTTKSKDQRGRGRCMAGAAGPPSPVASERDRRPWLGRLTNPGRSQQEARRTSRTAHRAVGNIPDTDDPAGLVAALAGVLAPGSFVAISHVTSDFAPEQVTAGVAAYNALVPAGITARTHREVTALFGGMALVAPGVVPVSEWRPQHAPAPGASADVYAGLATVRQATVADVTPGWDEIIVTAPDGDPLCNSLGCARAGRTAQVIATFGTLNDPGAGYHNRAALWREMWGHCYPLCGTCWEESRQVAAKYRPGLVVIDARPAGTSGGRG